MSTRRKGTWGTNETGPNGRPLCACGCREELTEDMKRRTCIPGHYEKWAAVNNPATVRRLVEERDKGICAECGIDSERRACEAEQTKLLIRWLAYRHAKELFDRGELQIFPGFTKSQKTHAAYRTQTSGTGVHWADINYWADHWTSEEMKIRFGETRARDGHTWEADHIIPVVEGGGECGLDNYRTLCLPCHRIATAALAKRRAERRQAEKTKGAPVPLELDLSTSAQ